MIWGDQGGRKNGGKEGGGEGGERGLGIMPTRSFELPIPVQSLSPVID